MDENLFIRFNSPACWRIFQCLEISCAGASDGISVNSSIVLPKEVGRYHGTSLHVTSYPLFAQLSSSKLFLTVAFFNFHLGLGLCFNFTFNLFSASILTNPLRAVSWKWGNGHPDGTAAEVKAGEVTVTSHRGNEIKKTGDESNPAVHVERSGNDVVKLANELEIEDKGEGEGEKGEKVVDDDKEEGGETNDDPKEEEEKEETNDKSTEEEKTETNDKSTEEEETETNGDSKEKEETNDESKDEDAKEDDVQMEDSEDKVEEEKSKENSNTNETVESEKNDNTEEENDNVDGNKDNDVEMKSGEEIEEKKDEEHVNGKEDKKHSSDKPTRSETKSQAGEKRKRDETPESDEAEEEDERESKKQKTSTTSDVTENGTAEKKKPGRPKGSSTSGAPARREKKVPAVGQAQRKTRSQARKEAS